MVQLGPGDEGGRRVPILPLDERQGGRTPDAADGGGEGEVELPAEMGCIRGGDDAARGAVADEIQNALPSTLPSRECAA